MMKFLSIAAVVIAGAALPAMPAAAQTNPLIIYGTDRCPANTICVRRGEGERYRIPSGLRDGTLAPSQQTWGGRAASTMNAGAASGIGSCSAVGGGGSIGCGKSYNNQWAAEKRAAKAAAQSSSTPDYTAESQVTSENPR
ncbi:hypothetical protein [Sphingomonas nostoxanthinifaciens]|uniref:hypothetical protein n=1 Tax=Sphingomonas nostoxanthinifaciens TaxID=2872652 RepID=UPI001CC1E35B|nr:hypothetical protein [Sphingomonas nostoxanthinifaciens]UAK24555.1 hypothetical protein K8P63_20005 [Sphingomonas nostoxanthinifaciens]